MRPNGSVVLAGLAMTAVLASAPPLGARDTLPRIAGDPARGRDAFAEKGCIACHAVRGAGGELGPDLAAVLVGKGFAGVAATMLSHYPKMRAALAKLGKKDVTLPPLSASEMDDLVTYLILISFAEEPGSVEKGRALFGQKGCLACHVGGEDSPAPPLGRGALRASPIAIAQEMWNHATRMTAAAPERHATAARFVGRQMADLLAFLSGPIAPFPGAGTSLPGDPTLGAELFRSKGCVHCHVDESEDGKPPARGLFTGRWYLTATELAGAMWNHGPHLRARGGARAIAATPLEGNEMADVLAYVYLARSAHEAGDAQRGARVFADAHCARCHRAEGPSPELATVDGLDTPLRFAATMWSHAPRMQAFLTDAGMPWPTLEASDVRDLVAFLATRRSLPGAETPQ